MLGAHVGSIRSEVRELWVRADSPAAFVEGYFRYFGPFRRVLETLDTNAQDRYRSELSAVVTAANRSPDSTLLAPLAYLESLADRGGDPGPTASPRQGEDGGGRRVQAPGRLSPAGDPGP